MSDDGSPFRIVGGFVADDGRWHVAVSDNERRATGTGAIFSEGLRNAVNEFRRAPVGLPGPQEYVATRQWAYVDGLNSVEGPDGEQWVQIFAWSDQETVGPDILAIDGRVGIGVPAVGARCVQWKGRQWMHMADQGDEFLQDVDDAFAGSDDDEKTDDDDMVIDGDGSDT